MSTGWRFRDCAPAYSAVELAAYSISIKRPKSRVKAAPVLDLGMACRYHLGADLNFIGHRTEVSS